MEAAKLFGASLIDAKLDKADLRAADLQFADATGASFVDAQLKAVAVVVMYTNGAGVVSSREPYIELEHCANPPNIVLLWQSGRSVLRGATG